MTQAGPSRATGLRAFFVDQTAATAIEYAIIASIVSIVILGAVTSVGTTLRDSFYNSIVAAFEAALGG